MIPTSGISHMGTSVKRHVRTLPGMFGHSYFINFHLYLLGIFNLKYIQNNLVSHESKDYENKFTNVSIFFRFDSYAYKLKKREILRISDVT